MSHPSTSHRATVALAVALVASAATASAQAVSYLQQDFPNTGNWVSQQIATSGTHTSNTVDATSLGGNGGSYLQHRYVGTITNPGESLQLRTSYFNTLFTYDPTVAGALDRVEYKFDLRVVASSIGAGAVGFIRPVIRQNGKSYSMLGPAAASIAGAEWSTVSYTLLGSGQWLTVEQPQTSSDLTSAGGLIEFGYRVDYNFVCSAAQSLRCRAPDVSWGLDNFSVQAFAVNTTVPEPSTWVLMMTGLAGVLFIRRRVRQ